MGRNSGSSREIGKTGNSSGRSFPEPFEYSTIGDMKHKDTAKMLMKAVTKFQTTLGLPTRMVRIADLPKGVRGVMFPDSNTVYLDQKLFEQPLSKVEEHFKKSRGMHGWDTRTSKQVRQVPTHELAHAYWNSSQKDPKSLEMGKELRKLYREYMRDGKKKGYGKYSHTNVDEFFAETTAAIVNPRYHDRTVNGVTTKARSNYYVDEVKKIIKKYRGK